MQSSDNERKLTPHSAVCAHLHSLRPDPRNSSPGHDLLSRCVTYTSWNRFQQTIVSSPGDYTGQQQKHEGPFHYLIKGKQRKEMEQSRSFQRSSWKFPAQPNRSTSAWLFRPQSYRLNYSNKL